jgi:hypothetical protein
MNRAEWKAMQDVTADQCLLMKTAVVVKYHLMGMAVVVTVIIRIL